MPLIEIIQEYIKNRDIKNEQEYILGLIEQLEFLFDLYSVLCFENLLFNGCIVEPI